MFKHQKKLIGAAAAAVAMCAAAAPAVAHHSFAMFDREKSQTITGVVKEFRWTNPHGYLDLVVTNSKGKQQSWAIEFQSLQGMSRNGLRPTSFKPGDNVTLNIHPLRNGTTGGDFIAAKLANGTTIGAFGA